MTDLNKLMQIYSNDIPLLGALQELAQRRESELRPADKFLGNNLKEQMKHVRSELHEVNDALWCHLESNPHPSVTFIKDELAMEIVDLQMSCETMLAVLGLDKQQRMESRRKVIEKNAKRGYYEPQQGSK